jgi:hypothetical protein
MKLKTCINLYEKLNAEVFNHVLYRPAFRATRARGEYASYEAWIDTNTGHNIQGVIYCNLKELDGSNVYWIIYHEMIHQYIEEFLDVTEDDHHGEIFQRNYNLLKPEGVDNYEE